MGKGRPATRVELTAERRRALDAVQAGVNAAIQPRLEETHGWDYPTDGTGDCNKFALEKRRELIAQGWPPEALLLTTATTERGEGHLVLVARTDQGDLVLDNRLAPVVDWTVLPYRWISIQSQQSPVQWVSILSRPIVTSDASMVVGPQVSQTPQSQAMPLVSWK
jgi:predicted transglutaminase-like cysteine proteinase